MQRGVGNVNPIKMAKCIMELEKIKGIRQGGNRGNQYKVAKRENLALADQSDLANEIGINQRQMQRYKELLNLIPELQDMVEEGSKQSLRIS